LRSTVSKLIYLVLVLPVTITELQAQEIPRGETVRNRARPEVDPLGVRLGGFTLFPQLGLQPMFNDNIFAEEDNEVSDFITIIRPRAALESNWGNHALNFEGRAAIGRYLDNDNEDYDDFRLSADGRYDITRNSYTIAGLSYLQDHIPRGSSEDVNGETPTVYTSAGATAGYFQRFNRLGINFDGAFRRLEFDNVQSPTGPIDNSDRDRDVVSIRGRVSYQLARRYEPFLGGGINYRDYDRDVDDTGVNRDSQGYDVIVGTRFDVTGVIFGEVFVGYLSQNFDDNAFQSIDDFQPGLELTWTPTGLTTFNALVARTVNDTIVSGASGILDTELSLRVDHELLRTLILTAQLSARNEDFQGIDRDDDVYEASFGAMYLMNRYLYLSMRYQYRQRESTGADARPDFSQNVVWLRIETQL